MIIPLILQLLGIGLIIILAVGVLSPLESMGWWAGWSEESKPELPEIGPPQETPGNTEPEFSHYVVYLSGIGAIAGDFLEKEEIAFLDKVETRVPGTAVVRDVFPYAMNNNGLTGHRTFKTFWLWIKGLKMKNEQIMSNFVMLRNVFQVAVSADKRYGPIYNFGTCEVILGGLRRKGYRVGSGVPVTLIGYSGGGQVAVGAATYLDPILKAPIQIISLGGVMADDPGFANISHLYHFHGENDPVQNLGQILYAGRWPIMPHSPWNVAKAQGKITMIDSGPNRHQDPGGYFLQSEEEKQKDEHTQEHILDMVVEIINHPTEVLSFPLEKQIAEPQAAQPDTFSEESHKEQANKERNI
jgi:hypothetical protein